MRHRTSLLSGLPLLILCSALTAQEPPPPPTQQNQMPQQAQQHPLVRQRLEVLLRGITLQAPQRAQVDSIVTRHAAEIQRLAGDNGDNGHELSAQLKAHLEQQEKEIRAVLTDEQKQTFDRNAEQLKAQRKGMD